MNDKDKANHRELLGLSFNGRLRNYSNSDYFEYYDYNIGDLIMVEDKRMSGDSYIAVGIITDKRYDDYFKTYQLNYTSLSTGSCDYGKNWIAGTLEELDKKVIKHLPKDCINLNNQLQSNWNSLREWLEEQHQFIIEIPAYTKEISIEHKTMEICYENILDKMNELEGKDKE